jgi:transcription initiation factor IIF auxiliary subunit
MTLMIAQSVDRLERGLWRWAVWLDGPSAELDDVEEVVYTLHSSFPEPVQRITDRNTNFRLEERGWGEFRLGVRLRKRDGSEEKLRHWLRFTDEAVPRSDRVARLPDVRRNVFLSFTVADTALAEAIYLALTKRGIQVSRSDDISAAGSMDSAAAAAIERSDAVVVIVTRRLSPWMGREIALSREAGKHVVPIIVYGAFATPEIPRELRDLQWLPVKLGEDLERDANHVAERVLERLA